MRLKRWMLGVGITVVAASTSLVACSQQSAAPPAATASSSTGAGTVPPPPGDATPKPVDPSDRTAASGTDKSGAADHPSNVGTAAAGAPPYTLNSAPEGNQGPSQDPNNSAQKK